MKTFRPVKEFLSLPKSEQTGIWVLMAGLSILFAFYAFSYRSGHQPPAQDFGQYEQQILRWEAGQKQHDKQQRTFTDLDDPQMSLASQTLSPVTFDPNSVSGEELKEMGLNQKQVSSIIRFREKGGKFRSKEDFAKMYVISDAEYSVLEPFIMIASSNEKAIKNNDKIAKVKQIVELNTADSSALVSLEGIGPAFARRIIALRKRLGGFYSVDQLLEVKGIDSTNFQIIASQCTVNQFLVRKINVNTASLDELRTHPYIGYNIALSLINYRKQHGVYQQLEDIKKSALITESVYVRISPYLTIQ